jgi:hypothetical protein
MKHIHHIIPKHAGGSNDPSNLIELSIKDHSDAHRLLYEKYGKKEDYIAWKMLSGKSEECELQRIELSKEGYQKFIKSDKFDEYKKSISKSLTGKKQSEESKRKKSISMKKAHSEGRHRNPFKKLPKSYFVDLYKNTNANERLSNARKQSKKWKDSVTSEEYKIKKCLADPRSKKIEYNGVIYPSIRNAAKSLGISYTKMRSILNKK